MLVKEKTRIYFALELTLRFTVYVRASFTR